MHDGVRWRIPIRRAIREISTFLIALVLLLWPLAVNGRLSTCPTAQVTCAAAPSGSILASSSCRLVAIARRTPP